MRKVLSFSGFLMLGLVISQFLPMIAGEGYGAVKSCRMYYSMYVLVL